MLMTSKRVQVEVGAGFGFVSLGRKVALELVVEALWLKVELRQWIRLVWFLRRSQTAPLSLKPAKRRFCSRGPPR